MNVVLQPLIVVAGDYIFDTLLKGCPFSTEYGYIFSFIALFIVSYFLCKYMFLKMVFTFIGFVILFGFAGYVVHDPISPKYIYPNFSWLYLTNTIIFTLFFMCPGSIVCLSFKRKKSKL